MNRTIKLLLLSDIFLMTGSGLIQPIFGIFMKENLLDGSIIAAGIASTLFLVTKSLIQIPFSKYVDKHDKHKIWLIIGTFLSVIVPFIYIVASRVWTIYYAQILQGIGSALAYPTWIALWNHNLDKGKVAYEWSLYSTLTGLGTAGAAAVGSIVAEYIGFKYTFVLVGITSLFGGLVLLGLSSARKS